MNGESVVVDAEPDVSENRPDVNMESRGDAAWSGTAVKDRELSNMHANDSGHVISL
jgi:hypothetical protein